MQVRTIPGNDQRQRLVIPCPEKIIAIVCMERPMDVKSLQGFLGSVNWFRRHIASHAEIQFPLNQLTDDRVKISEHIKIVQADQKKHYDARHSTVNKLLLPGAKAYLDIPYHQMVQHGLRPSNKLSHTATQCLALSQ